MDMGSVEVSVCMTVYNGEKYIREQITSVIGELRSSDELIICDDGSTDASAAIIEEYTTDKRINYIKNVEPLGVVKNFEKAILQSRGKYIFLCDQDDVWLKGKVATCIRHLQTNILVVTDCTVVDQNLQVTAPSFFKLRQSGCGILKNIWKNTYLGCCIAFRRDLIKYSLPIPGNVPMHDMWLGLQAEMHGSVLFANESLSLYRRHDAAASPTGSKSNFSLQKKINIRLQLCWCLAKRAVKNVFLNLSFIK